MTKTIFLSIEAQNFYFAIVRVIFFFSSILHSISLTFFAKCTPVNLYAWRRHMLYIQAILIAIDAYMELLLQPIGLFPAPAAFSTGIICRLGVPILIQGSIVVLLIGNLGTVIVMCVLHRHQSIIVCESSRFRLKKSAIRSFCGALIVVYSIPSFIFGTTPQNQLEVDQMIKMDPRNITWITQRGCYYYGKREPIYYLYLGSVFVVILSATSIMCFLFIHMRRVLARGNGKMSERSIRMKRNSIQILCIQLFTPLLLMVIPAAIFFTAVAVDGFLDFEHCLAAFSIMYLHSIVHNVFLLLLTPAFRKKIVFLLKCLANFSFFNEVATRTFEVKSNDKKLTQ